MKKLLLVVGGIIVLGGASAEACSCLAPGAPKPELGKSTVVMQGTVESVTLEPGANPHKSVEVKLKLDQSWKGLNQWHRTMVVRTSVSGASCGYGFNVGENYVVYAGLSQEGQLVTNGCTRTSLTVKAAEDLSELGEGVKPR